MRLDKYLKISRLVKRRSVAKEIADKGRIKVNDRLAKSSTRVSIGDIIDIRFGNKLVSVEVMELKDTIRKEEAKDMYRLIEEAYIEN